MAQFARPSSDIATGSWTSTPLWQKVDETSPSDADFISSSDNTGGDTCELSFGTIIDPALSTGHALRYAYRKDAAGGHSVDVRVRLLQGATEIASFTHTAISESFAQANQTLSGAQADGITNYADLRVEFQRNGDTGGAPSGRRSAEFSWAEFEIPDAASVVGVGQATATDASFAAGTAKIASVGLVAETGAALPVQPARVALVGQAGAAETSFTLSHSKAVQIGQGGENGAALNPTPLRLLAVNLSPETAASLPLIPVLGGQNVSVGAAVGIDSVPAIAPLRMRNFGQAAETSTSHLASAHRFYDVSPAPEADTARNVVPARAPVFVVGSAIEVDSAHAVMPARYFTVSAAIETDGGFAAAIVRAVDVGLATQTANANVVLHSKNVMAWWASENDFAMAPLWEGGIAAMVETALTGTVNSAIAVTGECGLNDPLIASHITKISVKGEVNTP